jgi:hypothetical protein
MYPASPATVVISGLTEGGDPIAKRGPKTDEGKRRSSRNALKHGLRAVTPVIEGIEVPEIWQEHLEGMFESLEPEGYHERELAGRIAELLWRLRRVSTYEGNHLAIVIDQVPEDMAINARYGGKVLGRPKEEYLTPENVDLQVGNRFLPSSSVVANITRYEAHLHRMYVQTLHELEALQARRRGERVPLARLDISGPPGG